MELTFEHVFYQYPFLLLKSVKIQRKMARAVYHRSVSCVPSETLSEGNIDCVLGADRSTALFFCGNLSAATVRQSGGLLSRHRSHRHHTLLVCCALDTRYNFLFLILAFVSTLSFVTSSLYGIFSLLCSTCSAVICQPAALLSDVNVFGSDKLSFGLK